MADQNVEKIKKDILARYLAKSKTSKEIFDNAVKYLPGGNTRTVTHYPPYPFFAEKGQGCRIWDCDGNEYIDFINNITSLLHGHAHPHVIRAINEQMEKGTAHGTACEIQYKFAEHLCNRLPSMDMIRFCNSGTEATMCAMQATRAFMKKDGFIRMDGGYHGSHDFAGVNIIPDLTTQGLPEPQLMRGAPASVLNDIFIAPFNNLDAVEDILKKHGEKIAGIIMEPMLGAGGLVVPVEGYLKGMRELADRYNVLLIFDEVITFRFHEGGMQAMTGVIPDMTAVGKIIGGGLPVGAFGGRRDIMQLYDPANPDHLPHAGTFNGNALTMAGGMAAMEIYGQEEVDRLNGLGNRLRAGVGDAIAKSGIPAQCMGFGSLVGTYFADKPLRNSRDVMLTAQATAELNKYFHLEMINQGIFLVAWGMLMVISTPMTETEIDMAIDLYGNALERVKSIGFDGE